MKKEKFETLREILSRFHEGKVSRDFVVLAFENWQKNKPEKDHLTRWSEPHIYWNHPQNRFFKLYRIPKG